jgi:hypothetical protein
MAGGLTTAAVRERKGTGKQVGRDGEAAEEFELALAEPCGLGTFGCDLHTCNNTCRRREVKPFFGNAKIGSDQERGVETPAESRLLNQAGTAYLSIPKLLSEHVNAK